MERFSSGSLGKVWNDIWYRVNSHMVTFMYVYVCTHAYLCVCSNEREVGGMETAHEGPVWSLSWHPLGHMLASGSNDCTR